MNSNQKEILVNVINQALNRAETNWNTGGKKILCESAQVSGNEEFVALDSKEFMPGLPSINQNEYIVGELIAFVADMRDSTKHLLNRISAKQTKVTELQRVYYETSALLPALSLVVSFQKGKTTEFLGDGILAYFLVDENHQKDAIYAAYRAAKDTIGDMREILNDILDKRYGLPNLDIGVGLGMSKAIISTVGLINDLQEVKAFGKCVFNATKLSGGRNEIRVDVNLKQRWPKENGGPLRFEPKDVRSGEHTVNGFLIKSSGI